MPGGKAGTWQTSLIFIVVQHVYPFQVKIMVNQKQKQFLEVLVLVYNFPWVRMSG
jgi:hypothetical protein